MARTTALWEEPRTTLTYVHAGTHTLATYRELEEHEATAPEHTPPFTEEAEPFVVVRFDGSYVQLRYDAEKMLHQFLEASSPRRLLDFVNAWGLPSLIDGRDTYIVGKMLVQTLSRLRESQIYLRRVAALLVDPGHHGDRLVRFDEDLHEWEERRPGDGDLWDLTGIRETPSELGESTAIAERRVRRMLAAQRISSLVEYHTRNTFQYLDTKPVAEIARLSDPLGTMSLVLANQHSGNRDLKQCALTTCNRIFIPQYRTDQKFCRKSHANSASNKKCRSRA